MEFLPNLFVLGAMKSGTTAIHTGLSNIPEICMSDPKEPFFFECEFDKGLQFYRKKYFSHWKSESYIGESRHQNLYLPFVPPRIKETNKNALFVVILRNPVERAFAHWWHWYSRDVEKRKFVTAIQQELIRINEAKGYEGGSGAKLYCKHLQRNGSSLYSTYIDTGYYALQLERYFKEFSKEQILILFTEDLYIDMLEQLNKILDFLGLNKMEPTAISKSQRINQHKSKDIPQWMQKMAAYTPLSMIQPRLKSNLYSAFRNKFYSRPSIDNETEELLISHFERHNERLSEITGRDLSGWSKPFSGTKLQEAKSD